MQFCRLNRHVSNEHTMGCEEMIPNKKIARARWLRTRRTEGRMLCNKRKEVNKLHKKKNKRMDRNNHTEPLYKYFKEKIQ